jgi:hypothetical protein
MVICGDIAPGLTGRTDTIQDFSSLSRIVALGREITNVAAITLASSRMPKGMTIRVSSGF